MTGRHPRLTWGPFQTATTLRCPDDTSNRRPPTRTWSTSAPRYTWTHAIHRAVSTERGGSSRRLRLSEPEPPRTSITSTSASMSAGSPTEELAPPGTATVRRTTPGTRCAPAPQRPLDATPSTPPRHRRPRPHRPTPPQAHASASTTAAARHPRAPGAPPPATAAPQALPELPPNPKPPHTTPHQLTRFYARPRTQLCAGCGQPVFKVKPPPPPTHHPVSDR